MFDATVILRAPPDETVRFVAVAPEEMYIEPPELTVVLFAVAPEEMSISPPELTVVLFAVAPEEMVKVPELMVYPVIRASFISKDVPL